MRKRFLLHLRRLRRPVFRYGRVAFVIAVWALCFWVVTLAATGNL